MSVYHFDKRVVWIVGVSIHQPRLKVDPSALDEHAQIVMKFVKLSPLLTGFSLLIDLAALLNVPVQ
jgi:hypothetical protein